MLRFRKILLCNSLYIVIFILTIFITGIRVLLPRTSSLSEEDTYFMGVVTFMKQIDGQTTVYLKNHETVIARIKESSDIQLGDTLEVEGEFQRPQKNTTKYLFNYQEYCYRKNIFYIVNVQSYVKVKENKSIYYFFKNQIIKRLGNNAYLNTFILGDKSYLAADAMRSYQENGISHLFAISGMHITLLSRMIEKLLKKLKCSSETIFKSTSIFLFLYLLLVGFSPSILRGVLFYFLFSMNRIYYFYINPKNLFLLILSISLLVNPNYIFETGFLYSYIISFALIMNQSFLSSKNYFVSLFKVSCLAFLVSLPITLFSFQQINIMSLFYNMLFVPFVSLFLFPFSLVVFLLKPLEPIYQFIVIFMEKISILFSYVFFGKFLFKRLPFIIYLFYFILIFSYLFYKKKILIFLFLFILTIHYFLPYLDSTDYLEMIDVGQGDSSLLHIQKQNILIDTGGTFSRGDIFYYTLQPLFRSKGISKIHVLILSHGDSDHMGEAIYLVNHFQVEKVIFNCGEFNDLEKELISVLKKKKIQYDTCPQELYVGNIPFYFLQTKDYSNENDNSNVIYTEIDHYKLLFMGDAGIPKEKDLLKEYDLSEIDILKVGHHGSKTCSSEKFIQQIQPKYSLISVGKDNKFKHPNKEVLNILKDSEIYRTDQDGTITITFKNHGLQIEICAP